MISQPLLALGYLCAHTMAFKLPKQFPIVRIPELRSLYIGYVE